MNDWFARRIAVRDPQAGEMARRSLVVRAALDRFQNRDRAMRFLNQPCASNGDIRPIDLAARDEQGLGIVMEQMLSTPLSDG